MFVISAVELRQKAVENDELPSNTKTFLHTKHRLQLTWMTVLVVPVHRFFVSLPELHLQMTQTVVQFPSGWNDSSCSAEKMFSLQWSG